MRRSAESCPSSPPATTSRSSQPLVLEVLREADVALGELDAWPIRPARA